MQTHPRATTDRVAVVINTASRTGARALPLVASALRGVSDQVEVHPAHGGLELLDAMLAAVESDPDLLVVGGGDGTIGCAAGLVAHTGTALGVLPLGTANDFARTLEIPANLTGAVDTLLHGNVVDVDLGTVDGRAFLNVASLGLSVAVTRQLTPRLKHRLGRFAYPAATLAAYRRHRPFAARLELDDGHGPRAGRPHAGGRRATAATTAAGSLCPPAPRSTTTSSTCTPWSRAASATTSPSPACCGPATSSTTSGSTT